MTGPASWLVLAERGPAADLAHAVGDRARRIDGSSELIESLAADRPDLIILSAPPAVRADVEHVAAVKRRRPGLGTLLVDRPEAVDERLYALSAGFDDAVPSTITLDELIGRAWLIARRGASPTDRVQRLGHRVELDRVGQALRVSGRAVHLRPLEYRLLAVLAAHPRRAFTREQLLRRVWGPGTGSDRRTVDVHVRWLRSKIEADPEHPQLLVTVRGVGYRLDPDDDLDSSRDE